MFASSFVALTASQKNFPAPSAPEKPKTLQPNPPPRAEILQSKPPLGGSETPLYLVLGRQEGLGRGLVHPWLELLHSNSTNLNLL